ncbi:hypothetical protein LXL04_004022 [Taraxacum kok-saghyz]
MGKTKMQVAMSFLKENYYIYYSRSDLSTNELQDLFFAHQRSLEMCLAFPHVMLMDATYNTIRYDMPLLEIVGVTPTNQTFCIAFVYMHKETESDYTWTQECLKSTIDRCMFPRVIVTDRQLACMKACKNVFPKAKGLICRWHINTKDDDVDIDVEVQKSNTRSQKQSRSSKFSWLQKAKDIFSPSTTSLQEPTSQKNKAPIGHPRLSTQRPRIPPTQDPQTQYPRRHSFATSMPDYSGSNQFHLNQELESHSTYLFREPPTFYSNPLMNEIPNTFHPTLQTLKLWREMEIVDFGQ